ncbi:MAG: hypothetical protein Q7T21_13905 [Gallionella sp.]|nr:hypothetical protein [Gallionella sp.]
MKSTSVATGDTHTCASLPDKTVKCWGDNTYGQLGTDWTLPRAFSPLTVAGVTTATAVTGGGVHTCALLSNGTVSCWGSNISGQLGDGSATDSFTPVSVSGLSNAIAITASHARLDSYGHTCALISGGTVQCWGRNIVGQLGTGNTTDSYTPVTVTGLAGPVTAVQAGGFHTCALLTGGAVQCWGDNALGQLGDGTTTTPRTSPVAVPGILTATALALGGDFSCALLSNGTVKCWGGNGQGRLGNGIMPSGSSTPVTTPVTVSGVSTAIAITAGRGHACAVLSGGTVKCWGDNSAAMLGNGTTTNSSIPITTTGLTNAVALTAGAVHTCARLADNTVQCWGDNANAQVGPGSITNSTTPATVLSSSPNTAITNVSAVTAGSLHGCGLIDVGTVRCWGSNGSGQLGTAAYARSSTANLVPGISTATAITAGSWHSCALLPNGTISCWGENIYGQLGDNTLTNSSVPVTVSGIINGTTTSGGSGCRPGMFCPAVVNPTVTTISTTTAVAAGSARTCAIISQQIDSGVCPLGGPCPYYTYADTVKCWGDNDQGQLGNGTTTASLTPVNVSGITTAAAITGGYNHTCALLSGGSVQCWGANNVGQLGDGTLINALTPVTVIGFTNATALGVGNMSDHACAVLSGGTVKCWGDNTFGQLGNGTLVNASTPVQVTGISTATAVAVGYGHTCARLSDSTVKCWGWNILGQLGNGTTTDSSVPVTVSGLSGATTVTAGFAQTCSPLSTGGVNCWGDNSYAQLGLGVLATSATTPTGISVVTRTTTGGHTFPSCLIAFLQNGPAVCVLEGNLVIRAGTFFLVLPLPPE